MKRFWLLFVFVVCTVGCEKDRFALQSDLLGTWELRISSGTIAGYVHTYPAGNGNTLTFSGNNHYSSVYVSSDTTISYSGIYSLKEGSDCYGNLVALLSYPPNDFSSAISVSGDTLRLSDNCISDGISNEYYKVK